MITRETVKIVAENLGIQKGDIVLIHSSFKSLGEVENGAADVIGGFSDAVGAEGTLVLPTFTQKNFGDAYDTWHLDKHSDTGYLTNYFRKLEGAVRSDQATHSVAAIGKEAGYLTETHGHTAKRVGNMGDTPFASDSPWEKMYQRNAKVVLLGVDFMKVTFRHYAEYVYIERCLKAIRDHPKYREMKDKLADFNKRGVWPHVNNMWVYEEMTGKNQVTSARCGNAPLLCFYAKDFVDLVLEALEQRVQGVYWLCSVWDEGFYNWCDRLEEMKNGGNYSGHPLIENNIWGT